MIYVCIHYSFVDWKYRFIHPRPEEFRLAQDWNQQFSDQEYNNKIFVHGLRAKRKMKDWFTDPTLEPHILLLTKVSCIIPKTEFFPPENSTTAEIQTRYLQM